MSINTVYLLDSDGSHTYTVVNALTFDDAIYTPEDFGGKIFDDDAIDIGSILDSNYELVIDEIDSDLNDLLQ